MHGLVNATVIYYLSAEIGFDLAFELKCQQIRGSS